MQNNTLVSDEFIRGNASKIIELFLYAGLVPGSESDKETAKLILIRTMWALLAENGQVKPEVLKSHLDDYTAKLAALAIPEDELRQAGLLPAVTGLN